MHATDRELARHHLDQAALAITRDHPDGKPANREAALALTKMEEAYLWLDAEQRRHPDARPEA